jgi:hypothetical protein
MLGAEAAMSIRSISPYQQMQNWRATQGYYNDKTMGNASAAIDNSFAFTSVTSSAAQTSGSLAAQAALARIQKQAAAANAKQSGSTEHSGPATAQANGQAVLSSLGLSTSDVAAAYRTSSPTSANGPYTPPTNPATGHGFAQTSASAMASLGALNLLT